MFVSTSAYDIQKFFFWELAGPFREDNEIPRFSILHYEVQSYKFDIDIAGRAQHVKGLFPRRSIEELHKPT